MENIDKKCFTQTTNVINKKTAIKLGVSKNNSVAAAAKQVQFLRFIISDEDFPYLQRNTIT